MKNLIKNFALIVVLLLWSAASLRAGEISRKGFYLDFGPSVGGEVNALRDGAVLFDLRLGGGVTDNTLLFVENSFGSTFRNFQGFGFSAYHLQFKVQQFLTRGLYLNAGVGMAVGNVHLLGYVLGTQVGFSASGGLGYEFRLGKKFRFGPEIGVYYNRIGGENFIVPVGGIRFKVYF